MTSRAFRTRRVAAAVGVAAAVAAGSVAAAGDHPFSDRFPNVVLRTHDGRNVRFYDDLLKGKIVLVNFMYASCKGR